MNAISIIAIILNGAFGALILTAGTFSEKKDATTRMGIIFLLAVCVISIVALATK